MPRECVLQSDDSAPDFRCELGNLLCPHALCTCLWAIGTDGGKVAFQFFYQMC